MKTAGVYTMTKLLPFRGCISRLQLSGIIVIAHYYIYIYVIINIMYIVAVGIVSFGDARDPLERQPSAAAPECNRI